MITSDDTTMNTALDAMRHAVPSDVEREPHDFAIDGALPRIAFSPDDRHELAALLQHAGEAGLVVAAQGARTALALGRPLARYDVAIETSGLNRVVEYVPDDLTITVEAGMHLGQLQDELREHGQYLPVDPPPDDRVSSGGLLATARSGAWRGQLPAARDLVLGATVALPSGALAASGGRVVKNVTGYDLHRLHTGALGAFGVIVEASFKVAPLPPATRTLALRCASLESASTLTLALWNANLATRALSLLSAPAARLAGLDEQPHVLLECAGMEASVERSLSEARQSAERQEAHVEEPGDAPWRALRRLAGGDSRSPDGVLLRLGVPPTQIAAAIEAATDVGCAAWAHVAPGSVLAHAPSLGVGAVRALREHARNAGGFLQIESGPPALRTAIDPFDAGERDLVRSLKQQFDPHGTLNRGRWMEDV